MAVCDVCGNGYAKAVTITRSKASGTYDSIEAPEGMICCAHWDDPVELVDGIGAGLRSSDAATPHGA
jgi:hypothetical protein